MGLLFALDGLYYSAASAIADEKTKAENVMSWIIKATGGPIVKLFINSKRLKTWSVCTSKMT